MLVGTALAYADGRARLFPALAALVGALLIQIGTNLANDFYDWQKGADTAERVGPTRVTQSGLISPPQVLRGALLAFGSAVAVGSYLVWVGGWPIVLIGIFSVLAGWAYTGGPYPLGYNGLGDLFAFVFFGPVAVVGTYFVQALRTSPAAWLASLPIGALVTAILVVNNLRDVEQDTRAGKRTLAVRLGTQTVRHEYVGLIAVAFIVPVLLWTTGRMGAPALMPLAAAPLAVRPVRRMLRQGGAALGPALAETARLLLVWGLLFSLGTLLGVVG